MRRGKGMVFRKTFPSAYQNNEKNRQIGLRIFRILSAFHPKYAEFPLFLHVFATARARLQMSIDLYKMLENKGFWCILPYPIIRLHKPRVAGSIPAAATYRIITYDERFGGVHRILHTTSRDQGTRFSQVNDPASGRIAAF
jgi:hypothetical protein